MPTRHETNHKVQLCHFITQFMPQDWFKYLRKKRRDRVSFRLQRQGGGRRKNRLAQIGLKTQRRVIKGSYFSTSTISALGDQKFPKITVEEPLEDLESENIETWQKFLREKTNESVTCRFCQGSTELVENVRTWVHLDCFSARTIAVRRTKLILHQFRRRKKAGCSR